MLMQPRSSLRVAFADIANPNWTAAAQYYENLFSALRSLHPRHRPRVTLIEWPWSPPRSHDGQRAEVDEVLVAPKERSPTILRRAQERAHLSRDRTTKPRLASLLRAEMFDAVFTCREEYGATFGVPLLSWIPDFQHLHLPELFPAAENRHLERVLTRVGEHATRVIVSSEDTRRDLCTFAPAAANKARVLRFVAQVPDGVYATDPAEICDHYHLPERFIYLPNQFWQHKNHGLVIDAIALAKRRCPDIAVVCTGNTQDHRNPLYLGKLLSKVAALNLRDNFIILGWVEHPDIYQLMRQSLAVLQASLFEGWSTTVEEARSVGKHIILSDISIHREQDPPSATFFDPRDPHALAECLLEAYADRQPGADDELEGSARRSLPERTREFGERFLEILTEVAESSRDLVRR